MYCDRCPDPRPPGALPCPACGAAPARAVLPDALLHTLWLLHRFGLGALDAPLLSRAGEPDLWRC